MLLRRCAGWAVGLFLVSGVVTPLMGGQAAGSRVRINTLIERLEQGGVAESGDVWTFIDMEHQPYDIVGLKKRFEEFATRRKPNGQLQSTPVVRIPPYGFETPFWFAKQVLDSGALGVVFPQVDTKEQALRAVQSVRYPPQKGAKYPSPAGVRGYGPGGVKALWGIDGAEYLRRADVWPLNPEGEIFIMVMVESPTAIKNLPDILDVPGIGAVFVGASDLSMNLGVGPPAPNSENPPSPELDEALTTIANTCRVKKVVCGLAANWATKSGRERLIKRGYRILL
ncbi:MAG: aldolase/citrate lyase family protein [Vicinamibacterales bacterium]